MKGKKRQFLAAFLVMVCIVAISLTDYENTFVNAKEKNSSKTSLEIEEAKKAALSALSSRMSSERECVYVYKDYSAPENHFTQKMQMSGGAGSSLIKDMDENCTENPYSGLSCIRCEQTTRSGCWGGYLWLNGYYPKDSSRPLMNDGKSDGQGLDLRGAEELRFWARGEKGGETVEFFAFSFITGEYPDSTGKKSLGEVTLTEEWKEYVISLQDADLSYIVNGFGYVMNDKMNGDADNVFYLDEIRYIGNIISAQNAPVMLLSYDTEKEELKTVAFSYDNSVALMAFLAEGKQDEAKKLADAFVYAVENDRALKDDNAVDVKRVRNAYLKGDISAFPGWEDGAKLPGWYNYASRKWIEDQNQVGSNVGNTSYVALALMQYYSAYGGEKYLETAKALMNWVIENCSDENEGFTGGFDGWEEADPPVVYKHTYKSLEHNVDSYAIFKALFDATGDEKYYDASQSALRFIESMYDEENGYFMTGTTSDGVTPNNEVVALDAQVWCAMALGDLFKPYEKALETVWGMKTQEGGYPFCQENKNGGYWSEGTAYTALFYKLTGDDEKYEEAMQALISIQRENGLFPAATVDNLSTGIYNFDGTPWEYNTDSHIAPAAWYIMAASDSNFNPYVMTGPDLTYAKQKLDEGLKSVNKKSGIKVKWGKLENADRYDVYAAYSEKGKKYVKVASVNGNKKSYTITELEDKPVDTKKKIKYYVVAYRNVNGKYKKLVKSRVKQ